MLPFTHHGIVLEGEGYHISVTDSVGMEGSTTHPNSYLEPFPSFQSPDDLHIDTTSHSLAYPSFQGSSRYRILIRVRTPYRARISIEYLSRFDCIYQALAFDSKDTPEEHSLDSRVMPVAITMTARKVPKHSLKWHLSNF